MGHLIRTRKRTMIVAIVGLLTLAGGIVAYAYWTTQGSGSGTAVTANAQHLVLHGESTTPMDLSGTTVPLTITADNPNAYPVAVEAGQSLTINPTSVYCTNTTMGTNQVNPAWFTLAPTSIITTQELPASTDGTELTVTGTDYYTLKLNDSATVNQDACQSATVQFELILTSLTGY